MFNSMFDELKEVKYFKEITDFKNLITSKYSMPFCLMPEIIHSR